MFPERQKPLTEQIFKKFVSFDFMRFPRWLSFSDGAWRIAFVFSIFLLKYIFIFFRQALPLIIYYRENRTLLLFCARLFRFFFCELTPKKEHFPIGFSSGEKQTAAMNKSTASENNSFIFAPGRKLRIYYCDTVHYDKNRINKHQNFY